MALKEHRTRSTANRVGKQAMAQQFAQAGHTGKVLQPACRPQPRGELQVSSILVGTRLRLRTRAPTVGASVMCDSSI